MVRRRNRRPILVNLNQSSVQSQRKMKKKTKQVSAVGKALRAAGAWGGGALGSYIGAPVLGGSVGSQLGALTSKWLGFGEYMVSKNSIITRASTSIPGMHGDGQSITVRHKEYIGQLVSSQDFKVQYELPLNPGMLTTFPWLAGVADRFQEYEFKGVVFHYIPTSGNAISGTSPSLGSVMMQTSYRATDTPPVDKVEMMNEFWSSEAVPSESFIHPIECDPRENPFKVHYIRNMDPPVTESLMLYDVGRTYVATKGQLADNNVLGDLWVTYEIELKKPLIRSNVISDAYQFNTFATDGSPDGLFGSPDLQGGKQYLQFVDSTTIVVPPGVGKSFLVILDWYTSNYSAFNVVAAPTMVNATLRNPNLFDTGIAFTTVISGSAQAIAYLIIDVPDPATKATIDLFGCFVGAGDSGRLSLTACPLE